MSTLAESLNAAATEVGQAAAANGWHDRYNTLEDGPEKTDHVVAKLALVVSEISEAVEEIRAGNWTEYASPVEILYLDGTPTGRYATDPGKPEGYPVEVADAAIRLLDLCFMTGIDLGDVAARKLAFNATRGRMHGGKAL